MLVQDSMQILLGYFDTEKLKKKHREVFGMMSVIPDKDKFSLCWFNFRLQYALPMSKSTGLGTSRFFLAEIECVL